MSLYAACGLTVIIETGFFALLGYRQKDFLKLCAAVNILTNLTLNLILHRIAYGFHTVVLSEICVIGIEFFLYMLATGASWKLFFTTAASNIISFTVGILLRFA